MKDKPCLILILAVFPFLIISSSVFCAPESSVTNPDLSLENAILIAFKNNKDIQIEEKGLEVARADILGARSVFLPHLNLNPSYTYNDKVLAPSNIFSGYKNDNIIGLGLTQSVYTGGANISGLRQAQLGFKVAEETLRAKKLDVEFETKRLYYGLLLGYETQRIAREALTQAKEHYKVVEQMYSQGTSSRFDLLQSKVQISLLEPDVIKAENEIASLKAELNKLLGRNIDVSVIAQDPLDYSLIEIREADFLKVAYLDKPEIRLKSLGVDIDQWSIQMAKSGYRPQVNIGANYLYRANDLGHIFEGKQRNWSTGLSVTIPLFEGFSVKAKVDAAKNRYAQAKLDKENLVDQLAVDIRQACLDLKEAEAIIDSQKDSVVEAVEALRISEVSYANGVGINLDVLDAQVSLAQVKKNLAGGIYDYLMARAYLDRNMARSYVKEENHEKKV